MPETERGAPAPLPNALAFLGMGISVAACVGVGLGLGIVADDAWHTSPLLLLIGLLLGCAAAVASVVAQIRRTL